MLRLDTVDLQCTSLYQNRGAQDSHSKSLHEVAILKISITCELKTHIGLPTVSTRRHFFHHIFTVVPIPERSF